MMKLRWKWSWIKLRKDGMFPKDRIKGKDKKLIRKWTLKKLSVNFSLKQTVEKFSTKKSKKSKKSY